MSSRRSYRQVSSWPSWGLYRRKKLNAAVRAPTLSEAKIVFTKHGYCGRIKKLG